MATSGDFGRYDETITQAEQSKALLEKKLANRPKPVDMHTFIEQTEALGRKVAELSRTFDVFLTTLPGEGDETNTSRVLDEVLIGGGGRALAFPASFESDGLFRRVTMAWNGSREASRAVGLAIPLLQTASEVIVSLVDQPLRTAGAETRPGHGIMSHLEHHKVKCVLSRVASGEMKTFEAILAETAKNEAQLLVMGAQAEGELMQWFRRSVSRQVLSAAPIPLVPGALNFLLTTPDTDWTWNRQFKSKILRTVIAIQSAQIHSPTFRRLVRAYANRICKPVQIGPKPEQG